MALADLAVVKGEIPPRALGLRMGVKSALVTASGHTGETEVDGRVDMILSPVVEQEG